MRTSFKRVIVAVAAMAALGMSGAGFAAAAPGDPLVSTIDPGTNKTLTIHKYAGPASTDPACTPTGETVPASCLTGKAALDGAEFTIYKVMDLNTNADWEAAKAYYNMTNYTPTGTAAGVVTTAAGVATFDPAGTGSALYYVVETKTPTGYTGAVPFFVSLPMTNVAKTGWNYAVQVYPKNTKVDAPHKSVTDVTDHKVGDVLDYAVSVKLPVYKDVVGAPTGTPAKYTGPDGTVNGYDVGSYMVWDKFDASLNPNNVKSITINGTALLAADYVVQKSPDGQIVQVYFTQTGLDKIAASNGGTLVVNYEATIKTMPTTGLIPNTGYVIPGNTPGAGGTPPTTPTPPTDTDNPPPGGGTPTNKVESKFGIIQIYKVGQTGASTTTPLSGVTFEVYPAKATGTAGGTWTYSCERTYLTGSPLTSFTTGSNGIGTSSTLGVSNWYNDGLYKPTATEPTGNNDGYFDGAQYADWFGHRNYCLVEVSTVSGYQLLAQPVQFNLDTAGTTPVTVPAGLTQIVNQADNIGNSLPLTGGAGVAAVSLLALALVGGGLGYYVVTRRREEQDA